MEESSCKITRWQLLKAKLKNLSLDEFNKEVNVNPNAVLLDVRTEEEFAGGTLSNARNLNYLGDSFIDELEELDPELTYLVFCRTGRRSARVCTLMQNSGFTTVFNLEGGLVLYPERSLQ